MRRKAKEKRHQLEFLLPRDIRERLVERPVVYLPLGTIEWHCEHLPVGLDGLTAHGVCLGAAVKDGGIVYPPLYYGTGGGHGLYPWTIMMPGEAEIEAQIDFTLERLAAFGVKLGVIFSGHFAPTQLEMIDRIADSWNGKGSRLKVVATAVNRIEGLPLGPDHAGIFETTLLSALNPDLVKLDRLPRLEAAPLKANEDDFGDLRHNPDHPIWGVFGPDPRHFQPRQAKPLLEVSVEWLTSQVHEALPS